MNQLKKAWSKSFTDPWYRSALHIAFWLFLLLLGMKENMIIRISTEQPFFITFMGILLALFLFYPLVYIIIPFLFSGRYFLAGGMFVVYYIIAILLRTYHIQLIVNWYNLHYLGVSGGDFWQEHAAKQLDPYNLFISLASSLTSLFSIIFIPLLTKLLRYLYTFNQAQIQLQRDNIQMELNFLKMQVNPHLLFNTLNNLQSFIINNEKEQSIELIGRFSEFMRISLYDSSQEQIALEQEIKLIEDYFALERIRYSEDTRIELNISGDYENYKLPSMLLIPFIDNIFKHGLNSLTSENYAVICIQVESGILTLDSRNNYISDSSYLTKDKIGGIGLNNVKRRLAHYYPNSHALTIRDENGYYHVNLILNLND